MGTEPVHRKRGRHCFVRSPFLTSRKVISFTQRRNIFPNTDHHRRHQQQRQQLLVVEERDEWEEDNKEEA